MQKIQSFLASAVLITGLSHIFCCGLPLFVSLLSVFVGLGVTSVLPASIIDLHVFLHVWELPLLIFSGVVLFIGWTLHLISERIDCHNTGCVHEPCDRKKKKSHRILLVATVLFCANAIILFAFHDSVQEPPHHVVAEQHAHH